jgi:hypothetical protein
VCKDCLPLSLDTLVKPLSDDELLEVNVVIRGDVEGQTENDEQRAIKKNKKQLVTLEVIQSLDSGA